MASKGFLLPFFERQSCSFGSMITEELELLKRIDTGPLIFWDSAVNINSESG